MVAAVFPRPLPIWWPMTPPAIPPRTAPTLIGWLSDARDISIATIVPQSTRNGASTIAGRSANASTSGRQTHTLRGRKNRSFVTGRIRRISTMRWAPQPRMSSIRRLVFRNPPKGPGDLFQRPAGLVGAQTVSQHRDEVRAHVRVGDEVTVAEEVGCVADLDDVNSVQGADQLDLVRREQGCVDTSEPCDLPNIQLEIANALSSGDTYKVSLSPGDGGMIAPGSGRSPKGRSGSEKTLKILVTATSPSRSGATRTTLAIETHASASFDAHKPRRSAAPPPKRACRCRGCDQ